MREKEIKQRQKKLTWRFQIGFLNVWKCHFLGSGFKIVTHTYQLAIHCLCLMYTIIRDYKAGNKDLYSY